jgi:hypothetical protein
MYNKKPWEGQGSRLRHLSTGTQSQPPSADNRDCENRRNAAACFSNPNRREEWHADFHRVPSRGRVTGRTTILGERVPAPRPQRAGLSDCRPKACAEER